MSYAGGALGAALIVFALRAEGLVLPVLALPLLLALIRPTSFSTWRKSAVFKYPRSNRSRMPSTRRIA